MKEVWKDIPGFEGQYQASTFGRIRSVSRRVDSGHGYRIVQSIILKPIKAKTGYMVVNFVLKNRKQYLFHRLIALTFIPPIKGKRFVNHKDFDKANNRPDNLEWCTPKENILHSCIGGRNGVRLVHKELGVFYHTVIQAANAIGVPVKTLRNLLRRHKELAPVAYA